MCALGYRFKLWVVNEKGDAVFGDGLAKLLEKIEQHNSILEAAKDLGMSYRYALHRITLAEKRLNEPIVIRVRGGAKGGGSSKITPVGKELVIQFRKTQNKIAAVLNE